MLLALGATPPCEGNAGTVGSEAVPCSAMKISSCAEATRVLREAAVRQILIREKAWPDKDTIERRVDEFVPSKAVAVANLQRTRDESNAVARALRETAADPLRDRAVWKERLEPYMTYEDWVALRAQAKGRQLEEAPAKAELSDEEYEALRASIRSHVVEGTFQDWVKTTWARAQDGKPSERWSTELQDRFWATVLATTPFVTRADLRCNPVAPAALRAPMPLKSQKKAK